jgi:ribosomal protein S12 methylthiotransferase
LYYGRSYADSPEVDGTVYFGALKELNAGDFVDVTIKDTDFHDMYGQAQI